MKSILFTIGIMLWAANLNAQEPPGTTWRLYTDEIPNSKFLINEKVDHRESGGRFISRTSEPTLTYYLPRYPRDKAIIICPGGGYRGVAIDKEGHKVARIFQANGIHAFVLKYRAPLDSSCVNKSIAPLQDAQKALRKALDSLDSYGYQKIKIGIMGFSAGGHLAATASNLFNQDKITGISTPAIRPDFSILIYPVIDMQGSYTHIGSRRNLLGEHPSEALMNSFSADALISAQSPRTFLVHASDDKSVPVQNSLMYYEACLEHEVPAEMHIYERGGHGFGLDLKDTEEQWSDRLLHWLDTF